LFAIGFEGAAERVLDESEIEKWAVAEVTATAPLVVLDLRTSWALVRTRPGEKSIGKAKG